MANTTILVDETTRAQLKARGRKGQTYDDVIKELLKIPPQKEAKK